MEKLKKTNYLKSNFFTSTLVYFISAVLFVVLDILSVTKCFAFLGDSASYIVNAFIQVGIMFTIPLFLYKLLTKKKVTTIFKDFKYQSVSYKTVLYSILIGFVGFFGVVIISRICAGILYTFGYTYPFVSGGETTGGVGMFFVSVLTTAILPAVCEEFINRGLSLNGLKSLGAKKAIIFSSLLFALLHFNINQAIYAFIIGLLLGSVTLISGSIIPAIIIHFMNNFSSVFYDFLGSLGKYGNFMNNFIDSFFTGNFFIVLLKCVTVMMIVLVVIAFAMAKIFLIEKNRKIRKTVLNKDAKSDKKTIVVETSASKAAEKNLSTEELIQLRKTAEKEYSPQTFSDYIKNNKSVLFAMMPQMTEKEDLKPMHKTFLYATLIIAGLMTLFTLIWGFI